MKGGLDLQDALGSLPGFIWAKYPKEKHLINYNYLGPSTSLFPHRLNTDFTPKPGEEPVNQVDHAAMIHDIAYYKADKSENPLQAKHEADKQMLEALENIHPSFFNFGEKFAKFLGEKILSLKLKLGVGIESANDAKVIAEEIHKPLKKQNRRSVILNRINEIHSCDLIELEPEKYKNQTYRYALTYIDCFSKKATAFALRTKTANEIVETLKLQFSIAKPEKLWSDKESGLYSKQCLGFLEKENVKLYSTESDIHGSIIERFNRTIKEKLEKKKIELELQGKKYSWLEELPKALIEYNNSYHKTLKMSPNESYNPGNEARIKQQYLRKKLKTIFYDKQPSFKIGDRVRIWKFKMHFEKGYKYRWTKEIFTISEIHNDHPVTYSLTDENGENIKGKFNSFELLRTIL